VTKPKSKRVPVKKQEDRMNIYVMGPEARLYVDGNQHGMLTVTMREDYLEVIANKNSMVVFLRQE